MAQRHVPRGASFAFDVARDGLIDQLARIEALDGKAGVLMAANGVLAGLLFGRASILLEMPAPLAATTALLVGISLLFALIAFANRRYQRAPQADAVIGLMAFGEEWLKWRFLGSLELALRDNGDKLRSKTRWLSLAMFSLIAAVVNLVGYFTYDLLTNAGR